MPLITRNHPRLTLEGARAVMAAAEKRAAHLGLNLVLAVVDDGGHLIAFERMDGAKPSSVAVAVTKARAAAARRSATGPYSSGAQPDPFVSFGLAFSDSLHQTPIRGGLPLLADGEVVGAIGVSAGTEDQDVDVAQAGAAALQAA
jgi:glc operon protein GlcG